MPMITESGMDFPSEACRIVYFERIRRDAEAANDKYYLNFDSLMSWGEALLELSSYQQPGDAMHMLTDSISKFEEALKVNPKRSKTHWFLGNALTALAFLFPYPEHAQQYFSKATEHFKMACEMEPCEEYHKSLEMIAKAPEFHAQEFLNQAATRKEKSISVKHGIMGLVCAVVAVIAWVGFSRKQMPLLRPRRNSRG